MMLDGGITPTNVDKNYIAPKKRLLSKSKSRKTSQASPPKFTPFPNKYAKNNIREALYQKESRELEVIKECTFSPHISDPNPDVRDADTFYSDQQLHERAKIAKLCQKDRQHIMAEKATHKPFLSKLSIEMAQKSRTDQSVHEKLYSDAHRSDKKLQDGVGVLMAIKNSYKRSKPNSSRGTSIDEYLYNDALLRK